MITLLDAARGMVTTMPLPMARGDDPRELRDSASWLIRLRWVALGGLTVCLTIAAIVGWSPDIGRPAITAGVLAGANLLLWYRQRRRGELDRPATLRRVLFVQLIGDLAALSLILHWTGGVLNPFALFLVFPVSLAAILLPGAMAVTCGLFAFLLLAGLVTCQLVSDACPPLLNHQRGAAHYLEHSAYLVALLVAVAATLLGTVYFLSSVVRNHRLGEERRRQHERIAHSRERMARVGMIAAGVAHSVRNPLHGVFNCLDLIRSSERPAEAEEGLALMGEGLCRIEQVTTRLLSLTRETPLAPIPADLEPVILETLRLLEVRIQARGIEVRTQFAPVPRIRLDPLRLQEALFGILDNAIAAVEGRPDPHIELSVGRIDEPIPAVQITIADNGAGVAPGDLKRVFDPFFSTKPVGEGTGLGLAIAKEVIEAHGGGIRFQSTLNQGTVVRVQLPLQPVGDSV